MRKTFMTSICLLASLAAQAEGPSHEVFPQLNALAVNYHIESNEIRSILYATNHEEFDILCDATLSTDKQEKLKGTETVIHAHTTGAFTFKHRISVERVKIYLVCEATQEARKQKAADDSVKSYQAGKMVSPAPVKATVKEENLDSI
jgi:hypothetical protein